MNKKIIALVAIVLVSVASASVFFLAQIQTAKQKARAFQGFLETTDTKDYMHRTNTELTSRYNA